jgi:hypothetical protein
MNKKISVLNITGTNAKGVSKELVNSMYELTKTMKGSRSINEEETKELLSISFNDITRSKLADWFADTVDCSVKNQAGKRHSRFNTWDLMNVPRNYFYDGQPALTTTVGKFVYNKFVLEASGIIGAVGYISDTINKGKNGDIDNLVGDLLFNDKINKTQFNNYIDRRDTLGYWINGMLAHTISEKMLKPLPEVEKKKAELIKAHEKELAEGNIDVMTQISDELVSYAKDILKDDPGMDLYTSGDLDFGNNYKCNSILKGAVKNEITGEYDFIGSSFMDGIEIKDIPSHANSILASQYPASIATKDAGYLGKKLLALLQMMELDEPDTDCGTKQLVPVEITKSNKSNMIYSYIDEGGGKLTMLDNSNIGSYIGKTVKMRSPMTCTGQKICSKCAGKLFYMIGAEHIGLFAVQISHADLNLALKAKHDASVKLHVFNPDEILEDI